jgi:hypothetical protein
MKREISALGTAALFLPVCAIASAMLLAPQSLRSDDLKLKDGSTISGTIVGYEANSFKVKTSYGYAVVQKDQVVSIGISATATATAEKRPEPSGENTGPAEELKTEPVKAAAPAATKVAATPSPTTPVVKAAAPAAPISKAGPPAPAVAKSAPPTAAQVPATSVSAASASPSSPPAPTPIREAVNGNTYTNETYRFHMYKPPDWDVIATAPAVLPGAITAMGTGDDTTYLLIGQEPAGKSLATDMDTTERRLRDVMENFRALDEKQIMVSGAAATEHTFRGSVDQHDWSGVVVLVQRGAKLYTIFGMTRADNDLVQIQENVIARAISSLQFSEQ